MITERFQIITANGKVLNLLYPTQLASISGISLPGTRDRTARSPFQDGDTYLGALVEPRVMNLAVTIKGSTRGNLGTLRRQLSASLNPRSAPLELRAFLEDDTRFRLKGVSCQGPIEGIIAYQGDSLAQTIAFRLTAHDSVWYSDAQRTAIFTLTQIGALVFPITFGTGGDVIFGAALVTSLPVDVQTLGDWDAAPIITLTGPLASARITNTTTGEEIKLNYNITTGEIVYIDTTPGAKDIYNNAGVKLVQYLADGDFTSFHLEPDSDIAPGGHNWITIRGTTTGVAAPATISWYDRYTGI